MSKGGRTAVESLGEPIVYTPRPMKTAARLLVAVLILGLTPGLLEAAENAWHLAATGHSAHAPDQGADHSPESDEHGCSGAFHLCSCHHSLASDLVPVAVGLRPGAPPREVFGAGAEHVSEPTLPGLERPPRA
jgi:hypothetical protein